jgi:hypothetical protein
MTTQRQIVVVSITLAMLIVAGQATLSLLTLALTG